MTSTELAVRSAIPPALAKQGVVVKEQDGVRAVVIPDDLKNTFNVLTPRSSLEQADPLWMPSVRAIQLDAVRPEKKDNPNRHWYPQQSSYALTKVGLMELAKLAGVEIVKTSRMPREVLLPTEIGWTCEARVRQSDGTFLTLPPASKVIDKEDEYAQIVAQSGARAEQRWLGERQHLDAKCETKAMLRAIRAALSLAGTYSGADMQKPFLVVAYNFAPDYSDPEIRRMLVQAGIDASQTIYGGQIASDESPQDTLALSSPEPSVAAGSAAGEGSGRASLPPLGEAAGEIIDVPGEPGVDEPVDQAAIEGVVKAAGATIVRFGRKFPGKTIAEVYEADQSYLRWIATSFEAKTEDQQRTADHARDYLAAMEALEGAA